MAFVRGLLDRILLVSAVVAGGLVPGFINQYIQRLGGRLDQARLDLAPWQRIADQFHGGDLDRLIQYHLASTDPTFHSEGAVIAALRDTVQQLQAMMDALQGTLLHQVAWLTLHIDHGIARATWNDWTPTFALSLNGLAFALLFGLIVWLLFLGIWRLLAVIARWLRAEASQHPP